MLVLAASVAWGRDLKDGARLRTIQDRGHPDEVDSVDHAYATLLAKGEAKKAPFRRE